MFHNYLVGGIPTPLKNMKVSWDDYSQYMKSHKIPWFQTANQLPMVPKCCRISQPSTVRRISFRNIENPTISWGQNGGFLSHGDTP